MTTICKTVRTARNHDDCENLPLTGVIPDEVESLPMDQVVIKSHVGGLVKSFERKAA